MKYNSAIKEWNLVISDLESIMLDDMSDRVTQIPYDFIYMWSLKSKPNEHIYPNRNRLKDTGNKTAIVERKASKEKNDIVEGN